ncbi:MAG: substrate-binding domain-containing protein [Cellvibrionaceae bacterium]
MYRSLLNHFLAVSLVLTAIGLPTRAVALVSFDSGTEGRLFQIQGSNTVGANLMKNLLVDYFTAKGLDDVAVTDLDIENEYRVGGYSQQRFIYVDVAAHGSSTGFKALIAGQANLSMSSRPIKNKEVTKLSSMGDMGGFDAEHVIAIDGLAVIVHEDNPIQQLNLEQIAGVFSGAISNWKALGGDDQPINLYARDDRSGTWDTFKSLVLRKSYKLSPQARRFESNDELSDLVSNDPRGIGFVGLASVRQARALLVSDTGTRPLLPQKLSVATEDYVLSRRLFLYTPPSLITKEIQNFVDFVQTDSGQQQVESTGFISQALMATKPLALRQGPRDYLEATHAASRLSVNFRFSQGSARLDNKAKQDVQRLVAYLAREENSDRQVILVGFGDVKQTETRAIVLSKLRAVAVKSALRKYGISTRPVEGFGAYLPVASNLGSAKVKNRRVEVWVR